MIYLNHITPQGGYWVGSEFTGETRRSCVEEIEAEAITNYSDDLHQSIMGKNPRLPGADLCTGPATKSTIEGESAESNPSITGELYEVIGQTSSQIN